MELSGFEPRAPATEGPPSGGLPRDCRWLPAPRWGKVISFWSVDSSPWSTGDSDPSTWSGVYGRSMIGTPSGRRSLMLPLTRQASTRGFAFEESKAPGAAHSSPTPARGAARTEARASREPGNAEQWEVQWAPKDVSGRTSYFGANESTLTSAAEAALANRLDLLQQIDGGRVETYQIMKRIVCFALTDR